MLTQLDHLPAGFLETPAHRLHEILPGPTLFHLPGRRSPPLFLSVLLHGNEPVGLAAIQRLLAELPMQSLPRELFLFVGNVQAARHGLRCLEGQPDYNRAWPGGDDRNSPEALMLRQVVDIVSRKPLFASVDVHNNTGLNPHYACINRLDPAFLHLATLFSRTVVYFQRPLGVQSMAFAPLCPSVTLECGKPGHALGVEHACDYLQACLKLARIPEHPVAPQDLDLFHTVARVRVPETHSFSFTPGKAELTFNGNLDHLNFRELAAGTELAVRRAGSSARLQVFDEDGIDMEEDYFEFENDRLILKRGLMPSMLTLDERVIRQDCLCYFMERITP